MKVIFYIGHHKVGSTALQVFLAQNWLRLARAGILYPAVESKGFTANLARALAGQDHAEIADVNIREPHSALAYKMMAEKVETRKVPKQFRQLPSTQQMMFALRNQIQTLEPHSVILCSEAFANFGEVRPELIDTLREQLPEAEFELYCTLRRPDDYLVSWHGQRLKVGEKLRPLSDGGADPYFEHIHFNFRTVIEPWAQRLPDARLILRPYSEVLAAGGSTRDFADQISADFPDGMIPAGRANRSLPRAALEIVRRGNHALPPAQAHQLAQYLLRADTGLEPARNEDVEMFGADLRATIAGRFAPIHDYLSDLSGRARFFDDINRIRDTRPVPEREAASQLLAQIDPDRLPPAPALRDFIRSLMAGTAA